MTETIQKVRALLDDSSEWDDDAIIAAIQEYGSVQAAADHLNEQRRTKPGTSDDDDSTSILGAVSTAIDIADDLGSTPDNSSTDFGGFGGGETGGGGAGGSW